MPAATSIPMVKSAKLSAVNRDSPPHMTTRVSSRMKSTPRHYIELTHVGPYPTAAHISYECGHCGDVLPSVPQASASCRCGNIIVDPADGCVTVGDLASVKAIDTRG